MPFEGVGDSFLSGATVEELLLVLPTTLSTAGDFFLESCKVTRLHLPQGVLERVGSDFLRLCTIDELVLLPAADLAPGQVAP